MVWNTALLSFFIVFGLSALFSFFRKPSKENKPVEEYLLANSTLKQGPVVSLLLSTSFGINTLLYQGWLGYTVGMWGLLIQVFWGLSYFCLSSYSDKIKNYKSLHDLLGQKFGKSTKIIAGLCTIIGFTYLMGWESGIGTSALSNIFVHSGFQLASADKAANWLMIFVVGGALFYTVLGGLKGNASADVILNICKILTLGFLMYALFANFFSSTTGSSIWSDLFPSWNTMREKLGLWGLITNIAFSLAWQFVDNSTWQSIIAEKVGQKDTIKSSLKWAGLSTVIFPGVIGTLVGVSLSYSSTVTQDNFFTEIMIHSKLDNLPFLFAFFITVMASVMSMIDGLFLASAFTLAIDILNPDKSIAQLDDEANNPENTLLKIRVILIAIAIVAIWGIKYLIELLGGSLFDFVYIVIITQLSLIGPVLMGFTSRETKEKFYITIIGALIIGFGSVVVGTKVNNSLFIDGAGTFTIFASILFSFLLTKRKSSVVN